MSSQCVCHTDEWCFYCEMYSPLVQELNKLRTELEKADKEIAKYHKLHDEGYNEIRILKDELEKARSTEQDWQRGLTLINQAESTLTEVKQQIEEEDVIYAEHAAMKETLENILCITADGSLRDEWDGSTGGSGHAECRRLSRRLLSTLSQPKEEQS